MFVDNIAVKSQTVQGHLQDLRATFDRLAKYRCSLELSKSKFFRRNIIFLGHVVSRDGIEADPRKVKAIDACTLERIKRPEISQCSCRPCLSQESSFEIFEVGHLYQNIRRKAAPGDSEKDWKVMPRPKRPSTILKSG
jgi:hypothetical protein